MPLPLLFIGIAAVTGALGIGKSVKAAVDTNTANKTNQKANEIVDQAKNRINVARKQSGSSLEALGRKKLNVLNYSMNNFIKTFEKLKNVDFRQSVCLNELSKFQIDSQSMSELKELGGFATSIIGGIGGGALGGALTAFGAYSAAGSFAAASTGTAIASLSGAAATNATLAFFGGGSLAAGGLGMAGGTMVLGGLVAGPALAIMGLIVGAKASKAKDEAYSNLAQARKYSEEMNAAVDLCRAIAKRADMFRELLTKLERYFDMAIKQMQDAIIEHGNDFRSFSQQQKESVAASASLAKAIKSVLDTPILSKEGNLTSQSQRLLKEMDSVSISEKGVTSKTASTNSFKSQQYSQIIDNNTIPDITNVVRNCCYRFYKKDSWEDPDDPYYAEMCKVRWSELADSLNSNYHLALTQEEYSTIIYRFGASEIEFKWLVGDCRKAICLAQASDIVESCLTRQDVNPMRLTEHDIDVDILIDKLRKAYGVSVESWQLLDKGVSTTLSLKKIVDVAIAKIPEDRMILSQNTPGLIIGSKANKTSQSIDNDTIPDITNVVRNCCYQFYEESWSDPDDPSYICKVRWSELVNSLNSNYHLDLTKEEYSTIIYRFGDSKVEYKFLIYYCRKAICLAQASDIVESCFTRQGINPMHLTAHDIDVDILIDKLRKAYGVSVESWQLLDKGVSTILSMKKIVDVAIAKVPEDRMILSQNMLGLIVSE